MVKHEDGRRERKAIAAEAPAIRGGSVTDPEVYGKQVFTIGRLSRPEALPLAKSAAGQLINCYINYILSIDFI